MSRICRFDNVCTPAGTVGRMNPRGAPPPYARRSTVDRWILRAVSASVHQRPRLQITHDLRGAASIVFGTSAWNSTTVASRLKIPTIRTAHRARSPFHTRSRRALDDTELRSSINPPLRPPPRTTPKQNLHHHPPLQGEFVGPPPIHDWHGCCAMSAPDECQCACLTGLTT